MMARIFQFFSIYYSFAMFFGSVISVQSFLCSFFCCSASRVQSNLFEAIKIDEFYLVQCRKQIHSSLHYPNSQSNTKKKTDENKQKILELTVAHNIASMFAWNFQKKKTQISLIWRRKKNGRTATTSTKIK